MMPTKHGEELVNDIYSCAYNGQDQMVAEWLRRQPGLLNMPEKNSDLRETILHRAVAAGRINTVFLILEQDGVDLFSLNSSGNAALHVVIGGLFSPQNELIRGDYYQIAELLVAANPEILNQKSAKDGDRSRTPLELVALLGGEKSPIKEELERRITIVLGSKKDVAGASEPELRHRRHSDSASAAPRPPQDNPAEKYTEATSYRAPERKSGSGILAFLGRFFNSGVGKERQGLLDQQKSSHPQSAAPPIRVR